MTAARTAWFLGTIAAALGAGLVACGDPSPAAPGPVAVRPGPPRGAGEPDHVLVRSILLPIEGAGVPGPAIPRGAARDTAFRLAAEIGDGRSPADALAEFGDVPHTLEDIRLANTDIAPQPGEEPRGNVERGLGDTAFALKAGEARVVEWSRETSPLGYRVVLRVE